MVSYRLHQNIQFSDHLMNIKSKLLHRQIQANMADARPRCAQQAESARDLVSCAYSRAGGVDMNKSGHCQQEGMVIKNKKGKKEKSITVKKNNKHKEDGKKRK